MKLDKQLVANIQAIIFDMDGVLVDTEHHHHRTEIATFKHFGVDLSEDLNKQFKGTPLTEHFNSLVSKLNLNISVENLLDKQNEFLKKMFSEDALLFSGVDETLKKLSQKYKIALATSSKKKFADIVLSRFGIKQYFSVEVTASDIQKGKPDPEIFLKAAELLNVRPDQCIVVEDSLAGMRAANKAGMLLIAHKASHNQDLDFSLADFVIQDLREIPGILDSKLI